MFSALDLFSGAASAVNVVSHNLLTLTALPLSLYSAQTLPSRLHAVHINNVFAKPHSPHLET